MLSFTRKNRVFVGFDWVSPSFTEFYRVVDHGEGNGLCFAGSNWVYRVLFGLTGLLPSFTMIFSFKLGYIEFYLVLPSFTEFYRVLPSFTEFYRGLPSCGSWRGQRLVFCRQQLGVQHRERGARHALHGNVPAVRSGGHASQHAAGTDGPDPPRAVLQRAAHARAARLHRLQRRAPHVRRPGPALHRSVREDAGLPRRPHPGLLEHHRGPSH